MNKEIENDNAPKIIKDKFSWRRELLKLFLSSLYGKCVSNRDSSYCNLTNRKADKK